MNHFQSVHALTHNVSVYVPSTVNVDQTVDSAQVVSNTEAKLSAIFGGCTAYHASGAWVSDTRGLVTEDVTICKSFASSLSDDKLDKVYDIAASIKAEMSQEAVSVEIDGRLYFV